MRASHAAAHLTQRTCPPYPTADWTEAALKAAVNAAMKTPDAVADRVLRSEVQQCIEGDDNYAPDVTLAKQLMGHEYELRLRLCLVNSGVPFLCTERDGGRPEPPALMLSVLTPLLGTGQPKPTCGGRATPRRPTFACKCLVVRRHLHSLVDDAHADPPDARAVQSCTDALSNGSRARRPLATPTALRRTPRSSSGSTITGTHAHVASAVCAPSVTERCGAGPGSGRASSSTGLDTSTSWRGRPTPSCCWTTSRQSCGPSPLQSPCHRCPHQSCLSAVLTTAQRQACRARVVQGQGRGGRA
jgi:hypothetical protein